MTEMTLTDHAEDWMEENGYVVPDRETKEWMELYSKWIEWSFQDFATLELE